jgi:hypothetical protein
VIGEQPEHLAPGVAAGARHGDLKSHWKPPC